MRLEFFFVAFFLGFRRAHEQEIMAVDLAERPLLRLDSVDSPGRVALAVRKGDLEAVCRLIAEGADPDEPDCNGRIPLLDAVGRRDLNMVRLLLKSGCSVVATNSQGRTALHLTVDTSPLCPEIVDSLIEAGADPNITEKLTGNSALHALVKRDGEKGFEGRQRTLSVLRRLVAHSDVNASTMHGRSTALHLAVSATDDDDVVKERVDILLRAGASADVQDEFGETPLHLAVRHGLRHTAECLVTVGTDVNLVDRYFQTALHFAASKGFDDVVRVLLKRPSCDVNVVDLNGETPLHLAAGKGHTAVVRLLVTRPDIQVDKADARGMLPLHKAIESGFVDVVQELLIVNCSHLLTKTSGFEMSPADLAFSGVGACRMRPEIAQLFLTAMETVVDNSGHHETPI